MPYDLRLNPGQDLVIAAMTGAYDGKLVAEMVASARDAAVERGWNIVYDMREATPGEMGSAELYWLPRRMPALATPQAARMRIAVIYPLAHAELAAYWETTFRNAGLQAKAFAEEQAAFDWARGK